MYDDIVKELRPHISADDMATLDEINLCDLRDDIIHSRMSKAFGKLGGKNSATAVASVTTVAQDEDVMAPLLRLVHGKGLPIPATRTDTGGVAMWLVQMAVSGFFGLAARAFARGCMILDTALAARADALFHETPAPKGSPGVPP